MRYFLDLKYDGSRYHGWQIQKNANSIQAELNASLTTALQEQVMCVGSGRTDTGVHALQQIAHFDSQQPLDIPKLRFKLNTLLPQDIAITQMYQVADDAHARFDAEKRTYEYHIHADKDPFKHQRSYYFRKTLDMPALNEASGLLLLHENFRSFSKVKTEVNNFNCKISEAIWKRENDTLVFRVSANRFLRGMVRALVGTLLKVGESQLTVSNFEEIIRAEDRRKAGRAVPAHGLYLCEVRYPEHVFISRKH